jgi:methionine aminopeptidase
MQTLNVTTWNQPRVSVLVESSFPGWEGSRNIIEEGDLLHIDFGITAMGLNTDTQHMAYVLRSSSPSPETDAPESLKEGMRKSNRMQEIVLQTMRTGRTGNEVLGLCLAQMKREGIEGQIFSHPIGDWGHDAGAVMGMNLLLNSLDYLLKYR